LGNSSDEVERETSYVSLFEEQRVGGIVISPVDGVSETVTSLRSRGTNVVVVDRHIDASVGYYGVMIDTMLNEANAIAKPLMLHIPTADGFVTPEAQAAIHAALDSHPKVTLHDYVGLDHGFAAEMGNRRSEEAAQLADARTAAFLNANLG
jgi:carboxymethylenebutenolidase